MAKNDWRTELRTKVREIREQGGPSPTGSVIQVPFRFTDENLKAFQDILGLVNEEPFGTAPAGTLEFQSLAGLKGRRGDLFFRLRREPPEWFGTSEKGRPRVPIRAVDFNTYPEKVFSVDLEELEAMKRGEKTDATVPVAEDVELKKGDPVTFVEATFDPFGIPIRKPGGRSLTVKLAEVRSEDYHWGDRRVLRIAWEPPKPAREAAGRVEPRSRG